MLKVARLGLEPKSPGSQSSVCQIYQAPKVKGGTMGQCPQRYCPCSSAHLQPGTAGPFTSKGDLTPSGNYGHPGSMDEELEDLCFCPGFEPVFASVTWESLFLSHPLRRVVMSSNEARDKKVLRHYR